MDSHEDELEKFPVIGVDQAREVQILDVQADEAIESLHPGPEEPEHGHPWVRWMRQVTLVEGGEIVNR